MSESPCRACGHDVSDRAVCPSCGRPVDQPSPAEASRRFWKFLEVFDVGVMLIGVLILVLGGQDRIARILGLGIIGFSLLAGVAILGVEVYVIGRRDGGVPPLL